MIRLLAALWASLLSFAPTVHAADWVFFDLGEVILHGKPATGYTFVPGVLAHMQELQDAGYQLGIITNTPEAWGQSCGAKFDFLQKFIAPRLHETTAFPWPRFTKVVQPPFDRYRKPETFMYLQGLALACPDRAVYISETPAEVAAAAKLGFATYLKDSLVTPWPSAGHIEHLLDEQFKYAYPEDCDLGPAIAASLLEQDRAQGVKECVSTP